MSGPGALLQDPAKTDVDAPGSDTRYLRLTSCPHCAGRRRALVEVGSRLVGRCLGCGEELSLPLDTEWESQILVVGRAGQAAYDTGD